jgi:hypothetical protein
LVARSEELNYVLFWDGPCQEQEAKNHKKVVVKEESLAYSSTLSAPVLVRGQTVFALRMHTVIRKQTINIGGTNEV